MKVITGQYIYTIILHCGIWLTRTNTQVNQLTWFCFAKWFVRINGKSLSRCWVENATKLLFMFSFTPTIFRVFHSFSIFLEVVRSISRFCGKIQYPFTLVPCSILTCEPFQDAPFITLWMKLFKHGMFWNCVFGAMIFSVFVHLSQLAWNMLLEPDLEYI